MPLFHLKEDASPHPIRRWHITLLLLLILGTIYVAREYSQTKEGSVATSWTATETQQDQGGVFGTFYHLTYRSSIGHQTAIDSVLACVDRSLSPFNPQSIISAINQNTSMQTDAHFRHVFTLARTVYEATGGAFDITVAPFVNAWGFGFREGHYPDSLQIDSIRQFVGFDKVVLRSDTIAKTDPRIMLDCSAIAKGYGVDAVGCYLESKGIRDYMVEIGGEIRTRGHNPQGLPWHIGVSKPVVDSIATNTPVGEVLEVTDAAIATSGNYRNYRTTDDGQRIGHTIDPRTGRPVQRSVLSATVIATDCATADAYATAFMVLGAEESRSILSKHPELQAYLICTDSTGHTYTFSTSK